MGQNGRPIVPLLDSRPARSGAQIAGIALELDADGLFPVTMVMGPGGQPIPATDRSRFVDASELVAMIKAAVCEAVREEIEARMGTPSP
jgi:hypothetical protein